MGHPQVEHNINYLFMVLSNTKQQICCGIDSTIKRQLMLCSTWGWPIGAETCCGKRL
jgi:hypothetical protein